jgi:nucleoside-diphosphate-sugar epimerase
LLHGAEAAVADVVREAPEWVALRYGVLYGPDTWYSRHGMIGDKGRAGELVASADVTSFVHVDDAAAAAVAALAWPSGVVNVCDLEPAAGFEWIHAFCSAVGAPEPPRAANEERPAWARGADSHYLVDKLGFGLELSSWRDGFLRL